MPIRLATILEVFTRSWITEIINAGEPYISRAAALVQGELKIDFAIAQALVGKQVTFGELVSHSISVNHLSDIDRAFGVILGRSLCNELEGVVDRWNVEVCGEPSVPIIKDITVVRQRIERIFEARHILVHELPAKADFVNAEVSDLIHAASDFIRATDQACSTILHGNYPLTQTEMNIVAGESAKNANEELVEVIKRIDPDSSDTDFLAAQAAWESYRKFQSEYRSGINRIHRGSIAPLLYSSEFEDITRDRIKKLTLHLEREEGEL